MSTIDLNSDLGEGFGPWTMGDDAGLLGIVTSASIACGGHAGDPDTMAATLTLARDAGVVIGAHPGFADLAGFGRRVIPMTGDAIAAMVAVQVGGLIGAAALVGARVRYVKPHGALANLAAEDQGVAAAILRAVRAVDRNLVVLAISGTVLERAAQSAGIQVFSEVYADRAYQPDGRLVPRSQPGAVLTDPTTVAARLIGFLDSGRMPVEGGGFVPLRADSICLHGDTPGALAIATGVRAALIQAGVQVAPFLGG